MSSQIATYVVSILSGIAVCIPLAVKLVQYVKKSVQEKNWEALLSLLMVLMTEAETMFNNGADRKQWVIAMTVASAEYVNYPVEEAELGTLIDALCDMTKVVNVEVTKTDGEQETY
jgi:hypothetical protein